MNIVLLNSVSNGLTQSLRSVKNFGPNIFLVNKNLIHAQKDISSLNFEIIEYTDQDLAHRVKNLLSWYPDAVCYLSFESALYYPDYFEQMSNCLKYSGKDLVFCDYAFSAKHDLNFTPIKLAETDYDLHTYSDYRHLPLDNIAIKLDRLHAILLKYKPNILKDFREFKIALICETKKFHINEIMLVIYEQETIIKSSARDSFDIFHMNNDIVNINNRIYGITNHLLRTHLMSLNKNLDSLRSDFFQLQRSIFQENKASNKNFLKSYLFKFFNLNSSIPDLNIDELDLITKSNLINFEFYRTHYPKLFKVKSDNFILKFLYSKYHDVETHSYFNPVVYLRIHDDVAQSGLNPYFHYAKYGFKEGRNVS